MLQNLIWEYLLPILGVYKRSIVSYDVSLAPNSIQIFNMLYKAFQDDSNVPHLIVHSDQG